VDRISNGERMGEAFYKRQFLIGALWNVVGGLLIALETPWIFASAGLDIPHPPVYYAAWVALLITFGIGYYMVYRDMYGNKNIVVLGIIGKLVFSVVFIYCMIVYRGQVPPLFLIPVAGDLVFVVFFWMFLRYARRAGR
jgi:hypothetical protein